MDEDPTSHYMAATEAMRQRAERAEAEVERLRAEAERLRAEASGWRNENDRHRALYVEAVKERDRLRAVVRKVIAAASLGLEGDSDEFLTFASEEYADQHDFTPDELAVFRTLLGGKRGVDR